MAGATLSENSVVLGCGIEQRLTREAAYGAKPPRPLRRAVSQAVKGFGCRPMRNLSAGTGGRRPKASREGTRGGRRGCCRLWRFDRRAPASDALIGGTDL